MKYPELDSYNLIGGTGVAIRINHRLSEDIDLFAYNKFPGKKFKLPHIDRLLDRFKSDFTKFQIQLIEDSDATLFLDDVKVQLRAEHQFHGPKETEKLGAINLPSIRDLLGMKLVALYLRNEWRDVYDLYHLSKSFTHEQFYEAYADIMSSRYCGRKNRKPLLYNQAIKKLKNDELLESLYIKDPMEGLISDEEVTPSLIIQAFENLPLQSS